VGEPEWARLDRNQEEEGDSDDEFFRWDDYLKSRINSVWRIRDVYPSRIRLFSIPDPRSRIRTVFIPDPGSSSNNLSILTPKKTKKWFLISKKYDHDPVVHPGSRIRMLTFCHPGSQIPVPDPQH
jgi:hypothetical protein